VPCITAARPSTKVHGSDPGSEPVSVEMRDRTAVLLDRFEEVGQVWGVLDLGEELIELRMFVCKIKMAHQGLDI